MALNHAHHANKHQSWVEEKKRVDLYLRDFGRKKKEEEINKRNPNRDMAINGGICAVGPTKNGH